MTWQTIETAPTSLPILVFCPGVESTYDSNNMAETVVVSKCEVDGDFYIEHDADGGYFSWRSAYAPTHWMPLPDAPE